MMSNRGVDIGHDAILERITGLLRFEAVVTDEPILAMALEVIAGHLEAVHEIEAS
jgi:hypothetical protein